MHSFPRTLSALAAVCLLSLALHAQTSITPQHILFKGAPQYAYADLLTVAGLQPNTPLNSEAMNAAAQRLANTGLFAKVEFECNNVFLTYKLEPAPAKYFVPARFDNLVWWTPAELTAELHRRHPLFTANVPEAGPMDDALIADITELLAAKGITATLNAIPDAGGMGGGKIESVHFSVVSPAIKIHTVNLTGLSPELAAKADALRTAMQGQDYSEADSLRMLHETLTGMIRDEGYLDAVIDDLHHEPPVFANNVVNVDVDLHMRTGDPYRIARVVWPGSPLLSVADFQKLSLLTSGDAPSSEALLRTRTALANSYSLRGYMAARTNIEPKTDRAAHLVSYTITVTPGEQYAFHAMTLSGVTEEQRQEFMSVWKMKPGMPYNGRYVLTFLHDNSGALRSLDGYSLQWKQLVNDNNRTVDLELTLKKGGPLQ